MELRKRNNNNAQNHYTQPHHCKLIDDSIPDTETFDFDFEQTKPLFEHDNNNPKFISEPSLCLKAVDKEYQYFQTISTIFFNLYTNIQNFWSVINSQLFNSTQMPISKQQQQQHKIVKLSDFQQKKINEFKAFVSREYSSDNEYHEAELQSYWNLVNRNTKELLESRKSKQWKQLGFQGIDPASDFRGAGIFGLQNLLYFIQKYPKKFFSFYNADKRTGNQESYPFSIAGLNITMMLFEFLGWGIKTHSRDINAKQNIVNLLFQLDPPFADLIQFNDKSDDLFEDNEFEEFATKWKDNGGDEDQRTFVHDHYSKNFIYFNTKFNNDDYDHLLNQSLNIFSELYCITFDILDNEWYSKPNVSYFDFPVVLAATADKLSLKLQRFTSIADVYDETRDWC